jgi:hypothetical protein
MPYNCEISSIDPHPAVTIKSRVNVEQLSDVFASSFESLVEYLEETGEDIAGPPFAIYYNVEWRTSMSKWACPSPKPSRERET